MPKLKDLNLLEKTLFFNIASYKSEDSFFYWASKNYHKTAYFQIKLIRNAPYKDIFSSIPNPDITIVYCIQKDTIFAIGAQPLVQSQILEALLEYLMVQFFDMYDESLLTSCYGYGDTSCNIFNGFNEVLLDSLQNFKDLELIEPSLVTCKGCNKTFEIIIKKSLIENSESNTIPLVYVHSGHALLIYVDKHYKIRGTQLVSVSY
ncbi:MAG: hypothetical protein BAJALOKI1v1_1380004 [Promethearchaeota archaeon]|nr:MAG: hypothetical protein BAJALOKI1v1_1380004 [Candidatus Lokiarchaeota archaeon]